MKTPAISSTKVRIFTCMYCAELGYPAGPSALIVAQPSFVAVLVVGETGFIIRPLMEMKIMTIQGFLRAKSGAGFQRIAIKQIAGPAQILVSRLTTAGLMLFIIWWALFHKAGDFLLSQYDGQPFYARPPRRRGPGNSLETASSPGRPRRVHLERPAPRSSISFRGARTPRRSAGLALSWRSP